MKFTAISASNGMMKISSRKILGQAVSVMALMFMAKAVIASTGIYATGYGAQEQGMGGVSIALGASGLAPAMNPAGIAFSGDRLDIGSGLYIIRASAEQNGTSNAARTGVVPMPELGYVKSLTPQLAVGIASWSAGAAMDYGYPFGIPTNSDAFSQGIFIHLAPTIAYRFEPHGKDAVAISLVGALSTIKIDGIEAQTRLNNQGRDWKPGYGLKVGWMSELTPQLSVGAFYASKVYYEKWSSYGNILPNGARFTEPEQFGVGVAFKPTDRWLLGFDWIRFNYADSKVLGNPVTFSAPLGSPDGAGFGFTNINAYRVGAQYEIDDRLKIRAGFEYTDQLLTAANTAFTFLVPVTPNRTYTLGATYRLDSQSEMSLAYAVSPRVQVNGSGLSAGTNPYQSNNYVALTYTKKF